MDKVSAQKKDASATGELSFNMILDLRNWNEQRAA
jgi:hypothetical protein